MTRPRAVVLLSGGMDSATTLAVARRDGHDSYALSFRYGQRHAVELEAARHVAVSLGAVAHQVLDIDLRAFGGSALTSDLSVPKDRALDSMSDAVPVTYVPARNTVFLSLALAWSEVLDKATLDAPGVGALRLRLVATRGRDESMTLRGEDGKYADGVLLDLDHWVLIPR